MAEKTALWCPAISVFFDTKWDEDDGWKGNGSVRAKFVCQDLEWETVVFVQHFEHIGPTIEKLARVAERLGLLGLHDAAGTLDSLARLEASER